MIPGAKIQTVQKTTKEKQFRQIINRMVTFVKEEQETYSIKWNREENFQIPYFTILHEVMPQLVNPMLVLFCIIGFGDPGWSHALLALAKLSYFGSCVPFHPSCATYLTIPCLHEWQKPPDIPLNHFMQSCSVSYWLDQRTFYAKLFNAMPSQFHIAQNHFKVV